MPPNEVIFWFWVAYIEMSIDIDVDNETKYFKYIHHHQGDSNA